MTKPQVELDIISLAILRAINEYSYKSNVTINAKEAEKLATHIYNSLADRDYHIVYIPPGESRAYRSLKDKNGN